MRTVLTLSDLMKRTRAGMGYCQGGLCVFQMLSSMIGKGDPDVLLDDFLSERWKGIEPVLFGEQLRQEAFKSAYFRSYGIDHTCGGDE